jgi:uncharacterized protein HemX
MLLVNVMVSAIIEAQVCRGLSALRDSLNQDLREMETRIMATTTEAIAALNTQLTAFFDRQDTAIADLQGDVKSLNDQIAALQTSPGEISASDQAILDGITTRAKTVSDKLDALDALTPPVVPVAPPTPPTP